MFSGYKVAQAFSLCAWPFRTTEIDENPLSAMWHRRFRLCEFKRRGAKLHSAAPGFSKLCESHPEWDS